MPNRRASASPVLRSGCPIAGALDVIGDRWTLLIIRDLAHGRRRYGDFASAAEGIPTNILAERLKRLEAAGVIDSEPYQQNPPRYSYGLTAKGEELKPVLARLALWGKQHVRGTRLPDAMKAMLTKS
ncbi:MAG: helix-turn-helix domain-containing protein [Opitutus sp.]